MAFLIELGVIDVNAVGLFYLRKRQGKMKFWPLGQADKLCVDIVHGSWFIYIDVL